ncbi:MAG: hypothetical protein AAF544_05445, partial [Bacteroidota bacterium]
MEEGSTEEKEPENKEPEEVEEQSEPEVQDEDVEAEPYEDPNEEHCEPSGPVVDMNHAPIEELMDLPGVDDWLANMIIDHRP